VSSPLRGAEIDACVHRVALGRAEPTAAHRTPTSPEMERRRREAEAHRRAVLATLRTLHPGAVTSSGHRHTEELLAEGVELILQPRVADTDSARRTASVQAFIRVGRTDERFSYAPLVVKNHEVIEAASKRRLSEGSLERLLPRDAEVREGLGLRSTPTVRRDGLVLAGAIRILQSMGAADPGARGAVVDRNARVWWLELDTATYPRLNLAAYDALYQERFEVLLALDEWFDVGGEFPTSPYWHRECLTCEFAEHCEGQLEAIDDVSLTRFTSVEQQRALRADGVNTRTQLAGLDPHRAQRARGRDLAPDDDHHPEDRIVKSIDKLDELIYRARARVRASALRILEPEQMGCPTADVEVDVDMESYADMTYLWGASVTINRPVGGVTQGHCTFVEWGELSLETETMLFADFWSWLSEVRRRCHDAGASFAAYCFWAQAEDGAMNRAVATPLLTGPTMSDLEEFRGHAPGEWIDLHDLAKRQIQTEGLLGLKQLAGAAGFSWRDENPSGEASMEWYEVASGDESPAALTSRIRLLEYNEDDCRATKALRDWLNGPAQSLPHRDDHR
jgi:predicted RecB family nuclease